MHDIMFSPIRLGELESLIEKSVARVIQSKQSDKPEQYISVNQAAAILNVTRPTIYEAINDGRLKKYKMGSMTRLLKSEVLSIVKPV